MLSADSIWLRPGLREPRAPAQVRVVSNVATTSQAPRTTARAAVGARPSRTRSLHHKVGQQHVGGKTTGVGAVLVAVWYQSHSAPATLSNGTNSGDITAVAGRQVGTGSVVSSPGEVADGVKIDR
ncbi:hypothetical protein MRX96_017513 [Rhipicephalus microplus]